MSLILIPEEEKPKPSLVTDPFKKECVDQMHFHVYPNRNYSDPCDGSILFTNGDTEGTQRFTAKTFYELVTKMQNFIDSLE